MRRFAWRDGDAVALVDQACGLPAHIALTPEEAEDLSEDDTAEFYVVELAGSVVGYLVAQPDKRLKVTSLHRLAVVPEWRRHGCGAELWHHLKARLRISLPPRVQYLVWETDVATQIWLHNRGWLCRGTQQTDHGPDAYVFCWHAPKK